jgi:hypothetical protein
LPLGAPYFWTPRTRVYYTAQTHREIRVCAPRRIAGASRLIAPDAPLRVSYTPQFSPFTTPDYRHPYMKSFFSDEKIK